MQDKGSEATVNDQITDSVTADAPPAKRTRAKAEKMVAELAPQTVIFESREKEPSAFDVAGIRPTRNFSTGRLEWEVEVSDLERFEQNHFVQLSRVVRKTA